MDVETVASDKARIWNRAAGLGGSLQPVNVSDSWDAVGHFAEDAVHAVSMALAVMPEFDFLCLCDDCGDATMVVERSGLCNVAARDRSGVAACASALVGHCRRLAGDG